MKGLLGKALLWLLSHPETVEKAAELISGAIAAKK
jgi:hypothetical protein